MAELHRDETALQMALPCVSTYHCMSSCTHCTVTPLSAGGRCQCDTPLPVPAPGFCTPAADALSLLRANCFRKCPEGRARCPGGGDQPSCFALGVSDTLHLVGPHCD